jgi:hypothetical protein
MAWSTAPHRAHRVALVPSVAGRIDPIARPTAADAARTPRSVSTNADAAPAMAISLRRVTDIGGTSGMRTAARTNAR